MSDDRVDFAFEAAERIEAVRRILALDRAPRIGEINELFRAVHSLKGLAGLKGYARFASALHEAEGLLDAVRLSKTAWNAAVGEGLDRFLLILEAAIAVASREGDDASFVPETAVAALERARTPEGAHGARSPLAEALDLPARTLSCLSEYEESRLRAHVAAGTPICTIDVGFSIDAFEEGLKALGARLNRDGEWIATLPQVAGFSADRLAVQLLAACPELPKDLPEGSAVRRVSRAAPPEREETRGAGRSVRLESVRLDAMLAEAEEVRTRFQTFVRDVVRWERDLPPARRAITARLRERVEVSLDRLARHASSIRTVPIGILADRLRRATERIVAGSGKMAAFRIVGGESEIDRTLADDLADPLLHILRNAIDHGIEPPEERRKLGKTETGSITMMVRSRSSRLLISIADDGRGIDPAAVGRRARELGWWRSERAPSADEAHAFLFRPGFSTASTISEISGRGVGLDLVAERVAARGGAVRVRSVPGSGARFEIEVGNPQAVFDAIVVLEEGRAYAFPLASVARVERESSADDAIPLLRALDGREPERGERRVRIVLNDGSALSAAEAIRQEMIVVRALEAADPPPYLIGVSQGRADEVILVLDPKRLLRRAAAGRTAG